MSKSVVKVIQPSGILDDTQSSEFRQEILDSVEAGADIVLIDLQDVTFMNSPALGALVIAFKRVKASGSQIMICSMNEQIRILFELTRLEQVFQIYPNRAAFEAKMAE